MNVLQSFMGCMYPGSIRTESIESMDSEYPDCRFQVANVDEHKNEVSRGELQIIDRALVYYRPGRFPTRWPIDFIRRYGFSDEKCIFTFEAGRRCQTGKAIYAFSLNKPSELVEKLKAKIDECPVSKSLEEQELRNDILSTSRQSRYSSGKPNNSVDPRIVSRTSTSDRRDHLQYGYRKRDASTSTDDQLIVTGPLSSYAKQDTADPRALSYALIDFDMTKALNESAQAHAANRDR